MQQQIKLGIDVARLNY